MDDVSQMEDNAISKDSIMKFLSGICATALVTTLPLAVPVAAAPIFAPEAQSARSDIIQIRDGARWYRGYRGHRYYRPGYRRYDDFWFPGGAFAAGALIGSIIANNNGYYDDGYYGDRYYGDYYGDRYGGYYGDRYRNRYYGSGYYGRRPYHGSYQRPCTPREEESGNCY